MKYVIIIPDGCADEPLEALSGRTPLQAAELPTMDQLATAGALARDGTSAVRWKYPKLRAAGFHV